MDDKPSEEAIIEEAKVALTRLKEFQKNPNWNKFDTKPCDMFKIQIDGRLASKGQGLVPQNIEDVYTFLKAPNTIKKLNSQVNFHEVLLTVNEKIRIQYQGYDGIWPVAARDFIMVSLFEREETKIYMAFKSVNYPHPIPNKVVRGELISGGYIVEKIDENTTKVSYISDADVKGSVPSMIKNQVAKRQGAISGNIEPEMKKAKK